MLLPRKARPGGQPALIAYAAEVANSLNPGEPEKACYLQWFNEVCRSTVKLIVHWMRAGFVHGVMNTDNMSVLGLTIDYGPYGWLEGFDPGWPPNTTDREMRRYCFGKQPAIAGAIEQQIAAWLRQYIHRLQQDGRSNAERKIVMNSRNLNLTQTNGLAGPGTGQAAPCCPAVHNTQ